MDLLNRCFKIFIVSLLNFVNTVFTADLGVHYRCGSDIFGFEEDGKCYYFMIIDFSVNGKKYVLSDNGKLRKLILANLPEKEINLIKTEIIEDSKLNKNEELGKNNYEKLINKLEIVKLYKATGSGGSKWRIEHNGSYYQDYYDFLSSRKDKIYIDEYGKPEWKEDSHSSYTVYVVNGLCISNEGIEEQIKAYISISEYDGGYINDNFYSWCADRTVADFGSVNSSMDFEELLLKKYKHAYQSYDVYAAYKAGYLKDTLKYHVDRLRKELKLIIENNEEFELCVELRKESSNHYNNFETYAIFVRPNMTYGELFRAVIKKCREIEKLFDNDFRSIRRNELSINGKWYENYEDVLALSENNDRIKLDIKNLKFEYYIREYGFRPGNAEDMLWKELNGICKEEEEEKKENKSVEQDNDNKSEESEVKKKVKVKKPEESKPEEQDNDNKSEESKVKKKVKVKKPEEPEVKKKVKVKKSEETKVKKEVKVKKHEESKVASKVKVKELEVKKKGKVNNTVESKVNRGGKGDGFKGGCCTCCKER